MTLNPPHTTWLEINLAAVERNAGCIIETTGVDFMAVVKGNAYGHGAVDVGKAALKGGASWLAVARVNEAMDLRDARISAPILVLGMVSAAEVDAAIDNNVTLALPSFAAAEVFSRRAKALGKLLDVHLKVDTGMGRLGVLPDEVIALAQRVGELGGIRIDGLFSHFAMSDRDHDPFMHVQLGNFKSALRSLDDAALRPKWVHICNTGASLTLPEARFNMVRGGQSTVGFNPFSYRSRPEHLEQALTAWKARLVSCKRLPGGWGIGYGLEYSASGDEWIGVVSAGFGDGIRRVPGNEVLLDGQRLPVVGSTCMDQVMVRLPCEYPLDTEIVLLGTQGDEMITIEDIAGRYNTVHVDFMMGLTARVPRVYYWE
jgi:alanine racemase